MQTVMHALPVTPRCEADDLSQRPYKGSALLTAFKAGREHARAQAAARAEAARGQADFRRHAGQRLPRQAAAVLLAPPAQPAFGIVSGAPAFAAAGAERAFTAAGSDRLSMGWAVFSTGINADLEAALTSLRARSRDFACNTDAGARYLELVSDNVVGSDPPRLQMRATLRDVGGAELDEATNVAVEAAWAQWCQRGCEITGEQSFGDVCRAVVQAAARDGEYLARRLRSTSLRHGFALQLLDVDRIDSARNVAPAVRGGNAIRMGVEVDALGRKVAMHLLSRHPGDPGAGLAPQTFSDRVPMAELLHGFVLRREEQLRGYPWCAPVLKRANTLASYEQHALDAAKIGAAKMGFYTIDKDAVTGAESLATMKDATGTLVQDVEGGMIEALPPGVGFQSFNPDYPHQNFAAFVGEYKRDLAAGLNVAHHNLSGNMAGVNYSSARIAELSERRHWRARQRWFIASFVRPVFEEWLRAALITGSVRLPGGVVIGGERFAALAEAATFQPPGWAWVDPEADIKAAAIAATYDMRSMRAITDEQGVDLDDNLIDKARLQARYIQLGLPVPQWISGGIAVMATGTPASAADPKKDPEEAAA